MKVSFINLFISLGIVLPLLSCTSGANKDLVSSSTERVEKLMTQMSLEEKVGQMTQITLSVILKDGSSQEIDPKKLKFAIEEKHVGSILNVNGHAFSLKKWHEVINTIQKQALDTKLNIPVIYGIDAIHGATYTLEAVLFPHNINMAASRNIALALEAAKITARQTRASGIRWNFDPTLGAGRQPLWSRFEETYGEDPLLISMFGSTVIKAYQGQRLDANTSVAACAKHFLGYSNPASGKDRTPAYIPERQLRQFYLPPFEAAVKAGVSSFMINSGEINGIPTHADAYLLKDVLRDELGFDGVVVSDWEDIIRLHVRDRIAETPKEAVAIGVNAGIDMSMVPNDYSFNELLVELVKEGKVTNNRIDEAVRRILILKEKLGLLDNPYPEKEAIENFDNTNYTQIALEAASESITLLKNNHNILPLSKKAKILLAGPAANNISSLHSSWSYSWQGDDESLYPVSSKTIKDALENAIGEENVICSAKKAYSHPDNYDLPRLQAEALKADVIVLCLGEKAYAESPGIINNLMLDENQLALAKTAIATKKPVILVLVEGRPRILSTIEPAIDGIIMAYRPASRGADAIVNVLLGDTNPSGKLPFTYPRHTGDLLTYDHKTSEEYNELVPGDIKMNAFNPQWEFGHGLSYTNFTFSNLSLDKKVITSQDNLVVTVTVKNTGLVDGKLGIDLFCKDLFASITPPVKQLRQFQKVFLAKGESKEIRFSISSDDLYFIDINNKKTVEPGQFVIMIEDQQETFTYK